MEISRKFQGELNFDSVSGMNFLKLCMQESLRLYPPLILLMRYCKVDIPIGDKVVPKGSTLVVSPVCPFLDMCSSACSDLHMQAASHRAGDIFVNPDVFDPWRWLPPRSEEEKCSFPFIAFGRGVHRCLGETFAYLQIRTILSVLFGSYDIKLVSEFPTINYDSMGSLSLCFVNSFSHLIQ